MFKRRYKQKYAILFALALSNPHHKPVLCDVNPGLDLEVLFSCPCAPKKRRIVFMWPPSPLQMQMSVISNDSESKLSFLSCVCGTSPSGGRGAQEAALL